MASQDKFGSMGGGAPVSDRIHEWLLEKIETWDIDKPLPSQNQIMRDFGVSLSSVNTAFDRLVRAGLVERHRGRGSFIARTDVRQLTPPPEPGANRPKVVVVSLDYFSELIWNNIHLCDEFLDRAGFSPVHLRLKTADRSSRIRDCIESVQPVAGVVLALSAGLLHLDVRFLGELGVPVVSLEPVVSLADSSRFHSVHPDYEQSGFLMAEELFASGCGKIAYVGDLPESEGSDAHERGIRKAFKARQVGVRRLITSARRSRHGQYVAEAGYELTAELIKEHPDLDGIVFDCALGAFGALRALGEAGKKVPDEVCIIGEGDYEIVRFCSPPLTVTSFDSREWIRRAVEHIRQPKAHPAHESVLPPTLIRRGSVAPRTSAS